MTIYPYFIEQTSKFGPFWALNEKNTPISVIQLNVKVILKNNDFFYSRQN